MTATEYSKRLGAISDAQFQAALDHFDLGSFVRAEAIPFGLFGQNVFVTSTAGEFVLRGSAHYDWQFPKEQFVANLLHEQTSVPVPWPYLYDPDESIFGWKYGYVIMPRMPGLQIADAKVSATLSSQDRTYIAHIMGENLREIQRAKWGFAGEYDYATQTIAPFKDGFTAWLISELRHLIALSVSYNTGATPADQAWIEQIIGNAEVALIVPYTPVLVMHDYKEANLTVLRQANAWKISGVFDLMEALIGDGDLDLVRQLATYMEADDLTWAKAFLDGYFKTSAPRPHSRQRLALYMTYDRMIIWEYFHRPANIAQWWAAETSPEAWITPYLTKLSTFAL